MAEDRPASRPAPPRPRAGDRTVRASRDAKKDEAPKAKPPKTNKYVVAPGHKFALERGRFVGAGTIVELDSKMAKLLSDRGAIRPFIEDDTGEDDTDDDTSADDTDDAGDDADEDKDDDTA